MFAFKRSAFERVFLLMREAHTPLAYEDLVCEVGAPNRMITDNPKVMTGSVWKGISCRYCIEGGLTVPHHQHQNYAENCVGNFKLALLRLLHNTPHAPLSYWCYAAKFLDKIWQYWSKKKLNGKCGWEMIYRQTPDISHFCFSWFQPVWFYNPSQSFPHDKMGKGFFLGVAERTGDGFSYVILSISDYNDIPLDARPVTLVCSVVGARDVALDLVPVYHKDDHVVSFFNCSGDEILCNNDLSLASHIVHNLPTSSVCTRTPS